ncbi:MAG TPA: helix-turn-helix domain-containing protein [Jiangellaceae bacterium]
MPEQRAQTETPAARRVLDAASELFYTRGINAVGVDLIAKRAGVTKKTLYDRFGSKDALIVAYLRKRDERWRAWLVAYVERTAGGAEPAARILATFDALAEWAVRESPRGCSLVNAAAELPDPQHPARKVIVGQKRWLRDHLLELCRQAGAAEPEVLADELALMHEGANVMIGLGVLHDPVGTVQRLAEQALVRAGARSSS